MATKTDPTGARLFFQLLHAARGLKKDYRSHSRLMILAGMRIVMMYNREDFTIADDMRSFWANLNSGAEK